MTASADGGAQLDCASPMHPNCLKRNARLSGNAVTARSFKTGVISVSASAKWAADYDGKDCPKATSANSRHRRNTTSSSNDHSRKDVKWWQVESESCRTA